MENHNHKSSQGKVWPSIKRTCLQEYYYVNSNTGSATTVI